MNSDDDRFRVRLGRPKNRQQKFVSQVVKEVSKAGGKSVRKTGSGAAHETGARPGSRLGRGHTAARFAGQSLGVLARRVTIKARVVNLKQTGARSTQTHLHYIERDGVGRDGTPGRAYAAGTDEADLPAFAERGQEDRHQFRFIVSPEDADQLEDMHRYTRTLMARMEADLGTRLDWVAVDHWNTDNPHTHVVVRGKDEGGRDLVIAGDYISHGMRRRGAELATEWLGPRTELEVRQSLLREVDQERWTSLDRMLQREAQDGLVRLESAATHEWRRQQHTLLLGRLQYLARMGLAQEEEAGVWSLHTDTESILRSMGERGDIVRTMQRAMGNQRRELAVFSADEEMRAITGRIMDKGLADELHDRGYLIVDGIDGRAHYVALNPHVDLAQFPIGAIAQVRSQTEVRAVDHNVTALAIDGIYRTEHHLAFAQREATPVRDSQEVVASHVRRLEALRRAGVVERIEEGVWRVPADLSERGRQYDVQRLGGVAVDVRSHLPIERQIRAMGATWLDQQLIGGAGAIGNDGFGNDTRIALRQRTDFLIEQGLAERRGQRVILARNLLSTLRDREVKATVQDIAARTGLTYRPVVDGERVSGVYRRSELLVSGRFAMLDDGVGFSLVPWQPVIEPRIGQSMTAVVRDGRVSWSFGRQRGMGR